MRILFIESVDSVHLCFAVVAFLGLLCQYLIFGFQGESFCYRQSDYLLFRCFHDIRLLEISDWFPRLELFSLIFLFLYFSQLCILLGLP